jgi:8-hydroxy-5-deazaflavin:NADPH oxidoreductase
VAAGESEDEMPAVRIAIVGAGDIGATLGSKWIGVGHRVAFGVRDPGSDKVASLRARLGGYPQVTSVSEALTDADVVLLAVTGAAVSQVAADYGRQLDNRVVIDATNQLVKGRTEAAGGWGERATLNGIAAVREHAPGARLYRAFNSYAWEVFADPVFNGQRADLFYCGPADEGQQVVEELITDVGLRPVRIGDLDRAEDVDNVLALWASLAIFEGKGRANVAFTVLER